VPNVGNHLRRPNLGTRTRAAALLAAAVATTAAGVLQAPAASAGVLPSTTTVSASPATSYAGTPVTVTATVSLLGLPGLGITPTGSVSFAFDRGTTHVNIGSAALGACLLTTCTASRTTSSLPAGGAGIITAVYSGDTFLTPSSATTGVTVNFQPDPPPTSSTSASCAPNTACSTQQITANNGDNTLTVSSPSSGSGDTITASLTEGQTLTCPGQTDQSTGAALATFDNTANVEKTIVYRIDDDAGAVALSNNYSNNGAQYISCFASTTPFQGYRRLGPGPGNYTYGAAQQVTTPYGVFYEAQLGQCVNNGGQRPCFQLLDGSGLPAGQKYVEITVHTLPGDPKLYP
jgi:hypothetical protein